MDDLSFKNLPPEVQHHLRDLTFQSAATLAIGARRERDAAKEREYPTDPAEGVREVRSIRSKAVKVDVDDPISFSLATMVLANIAIQSPHFTEYEGKALVEVMTLAEASLRDWQSRNDEVTDRLRVITHPHRTAQ